MLCMHSSHRISNSSVIYSCEWLCAHDVSNEKKEWKARKRKKRIRDREEKVRERGEKQRKGERERERRKGERKRGEKKRKYIIIILAESGRFWERKIHL